MITKRQRKIIVFMLKIGAFREMVSMRLIWIDARPGFKWILSKIKSCQVVDGYHHAPACPANHYHKQRLVFQPCTCGASKLDRVK